MGDDKRPDPHQLAVSLIRSVRTGSLATVDDGQPFASLVTPAAAPDRSLLLLLSGLSPHTRHLLREPRCSILLVGAPAERNPQTSPRISLVGDASREPDPAMKARWLALHPYAAFYAGLGDFQLWRVRLRSAQLVGGFASAHRLGADDLTPDPAALATIAAAESHILLRCNTDYPAEIDRVARAHGGAGTGWRMVACDPDGCDLALGDSVTRVAWPSFASSAEQVRSALLSLASAAPNPVAPTLEAGV